MVLLVKSNGLFWTDGIELSLPELWLCGCIEIISANIFLFINNLPTTITVLKMRQLMVLIKSLTIYCRLANFDEKNKIINKQINVNKCILNKNEASLKINKKRRNSDIADSTWLITKTNINTINESESEDIDISDSDEDKSIISAQNKCISKDSIVNNDKKDSEDVIILPNRNNEKEENNKESDDNIIIKDMDMDETPWRMKEMPLRDKNMNKPKYKRKFSFKNRRKHMNKSDGKSKHYETRNNNNMNDKSVNMFNNVNENNKIPKDTNLMVDLLSGML